MTGAATAEDIFDAFGRTDPADRRTAHWTRPASVARPAYAPAGGAPGPSDGCASAPDVEAAGEPPAGASDATAIVHVPEARAELVVGPDFERAAAYAGEARSRNTRRAYSAQWRGFVSWCREHGYDPLPCLPTVLAAYLAHRADRGIRVSTLGILLAAVTAQHRAHGYPSPRQAPVVETTWAGVRRTRGTAPVRKSPVLPQDLRNMVATLDTSSLLGLRDAAILALGFAGAFRRSELVALDVADLTFTEEGLVVLVRRSKTDQDGAGQVVGVAFAGDPKVCPVRALRRWLDAAGITEGPVFVRLDHGGRHRSERLHDRGVARIVKRLAGRAGLDASRYSGHSLRAGHATAAYRAGKSILAIQRQGRWASATMVTTTYIREIALFEDNSSAGLL